MKTAGHAANVFTCTVTCLVRADAHSNNMKCERKKTIRRYCLIGTCSWRFETNELRRWSRVGCDYDTRGTIDHWKICSGVP